MGHHCAPRCRQCVSSQRSQRQNSNEATPRGCITCIFCRFISRFCRFSSMSFRRFPSISSIVTGRKSLPSSCTVKLHSSTQVKDATHHLLIAHKKCSSGQQAPWTSLLPRRCHKTLEELASQTPPQSCSQCPSTFSAWRVIQFLWIGSEFSGHDAVAQQLRTLSVLP